MTAFSFRAPALQDPEVKRRGRGFQQDSHGSLAQREAPLEAHTRNQQGARQPAVPRVSRLAMAAILPAMGFSRGLSSRGRAFPSDFDAPVSIRDSLQPANGQRPASRPISAQKGKRRSPEASTASATFRAPAKIQRVEAPRGSNAGEVNRRDRKHGSETVRAPDSPAAHIARLGRQMDEQSVVSRSDALAGGRAAEARSTSSGLVNAATAPVPVATGAPGGAAPPGVKIRTLEEIRAEKAAAGLSQGSTPAALRTKTRALLKQAAAALADHPARRVRHHAPVPAPNPPSSSGANQASAPADCTAVRELGRITKPVILSRHPEPPKQEGTAAAAAPAVPGGVSLPERDVGTKRQRSPIVFSRPPSSAAAQSAAGVGPPIKRLAVPREEGRDAVGAVPTVHWPADITNGPPSTGSLQAPVSVGKPVNGLDKLRLAIGRVAKARDSRRARAAAPAQDGGSNASVSTTEAKGVDTPAGMSSEITAGGVLANDLAGNHMNGVAKAEKSDGGAPPRRSRPALKAAVKPAEPDVEYEHKVWSIERAGVKLDVKYYMHVPKVGTTRRVIRYLVRGKRLEKN